CKGRHPLPPVLRLSSLWMLDLWRWSAAAISLSVFFSNRSA
ncbi:hypothetical protein AAKU64_004582, partial [Undibacterium sp. GrIS 1.8]